MGMTLWLNTLHGRDYSPDSNDHSAMHRHSDALDALCVEAGTRQLSEFFDFTDLEYNYSDEIDEDEEVESEVDPETGYAYGIDDMQWFDSVEGLSTLRALHAALSSGALRELDDDERAELLDELEDCVETLQAAGDATVKFHLAVVE